jgi:hypothetical protein
MLLLLLDTVLLLILMSMCGMNGTNDIQLLHAINHIFAPHIVERNQQNSILLHTSHFLDISQRNKYALTSFHEIIVEAIALLS